MNRPAPSPVPPSIGTVSDRILVRAREAGRPALAGNNVAEFMNPGDADLMETHVAAAMAQVLRALAIDVEHDPNAKATAERVARMYVREVFAGRYEPQPTLTDFPNHKKLDELYAVGPIPIYSACSHHLCPVQGHAWCGVVPGERIIGLSKFDRLARWVMARPHMQEEATVELADHLELLLKPRGLAVVLRLTHGCMTWRGVRAAGTVMTSNVTRGILREASTSRAEFFATINSQGFSCQ